MRTFWQSMSSKFFWLVAYGSIALITADAAFAQRGREGGGGGGGGGGRQAGGGGGGGARAQGNVGGGARAAAQGNVGGGARAAAPGAGVSGGARANVGQGGAAVSGGARAVNPSGGATFRGPTAGGGAAVGGNIGGAARATAPGAGAAADLNAGGAARARANIPQVGADGGIRSGAAIRSETARSIDAARANLDGGARTTLRPNFDGQVDGRGRADVDARGRADLDGRGRADIDGRGRADLDGRARADFDGRDRFDADARARASSNFRPNWAGRDLDSSFRTTFGNALNSRAFRDRDGDRFDRDRDRGDRDRWDRDGYWGRWGNRVRGGFYVGPNPYFNTGFWSGRNLIGFGLGGYNYGIGGWGYGGPGRWWGYSPWLGYRPWNYWYGNPGWNTFAGYYGWNSPYYYDYGPYGNVVYRDNYVYVNDQQVGTAEDYAQSAAELAMVTEEQMNAEHEWMPLGTFAVATKQDETNPPRVAQLAYDNKQGLISGTIFNRDSNNLYTLQGKVDPQTQRVAFTVGKDPNVVMETGLYNLTQNETPVLVHFGANKTATYLFTRLEEPESQGSQGPGTTAAAPPADDFRR
jgi:hypothetical protein